MNPMTNCYMNAFVELIWWIYDVAHRWCILWNYIVESLLCRRCRWCCQVVEVVRWCCISCWVHAYSCKVRGLCPVECLIIQTTLILRAYALHVDLGVDAPHVDFKSHCSTRWIESLCSNTLLVPHAYCIVKLLLCLCIVASSSSCCSWFDAK